MSRRLPVLMSEAQRFDCRGCTHCCRDWIVYVSDEERARIVAAGWAQRLGGERLFVKFRHRGRTRYRLAQRDDGRCVFLGDDNQCRLHAETGADVKPLPCRMYPFAPVPAVGGIGLAVRMDCPSVAENAGRPLEAHRSAVGRLVREAGIQPASSPPLWRRSQRLSEMEFSALCDAFVRVLAEDSRSFRHRLAAGGHLLDLVIQVQLDKVHEQRFVELMDLLRASALAELDAPDAVAGEVARRTERLLRQWIFLHGWLETSRDVGGGPARRWTRSWRRYLQARRFAGGEGPVPAVMPDWPACRFEEVAAVAPAADDTALEPVVRSLRTRIEAQAFAGPGYFGYDAVSGLTALWLSVAAIGWYARFEAVRRQGAALSAEDVREGLRRVHRTFGVSPAFGRVSEKLRMQAFARVGVVRTLVDRYGP